MCLRSGIRAVVRKAGQDRDEHRSRKDFQDMRFLDQSQGVGRSQGIELRGIQALNPDVHGGQIRGDRSELRDDIPGEGMNPAGRLA